MYKLFLDDERQPPDDGSSWIIVRSYEEAIKFIDEHGSPGYISFDNDLGPNQKEGIDLAKWLIEKDLDNNCRFLLVDFDFYVHSQNPVAARLIEDKFRTYLKRR